VFPVVCIWPTPAHCKHDRLIEFSAPQSCCSLHCSLHFLSVYEAWSLLMVELWCPCCCSRHQCVCPRGLCSAAAAAAAAGQLQGMAERPCVPGCRTLSESVAGTQTVFARLSTGLQGLVGKSKLTAILLNIPDFDPAGGCLQQSRWDQGSTAARTAYCCQDGAINRFML
jgi:hypothetical protein